MDNIKSDYTKLLRNHTVNLLNDVISMEYTIRAVALADQESFIKLKKINHAIIKFWTDLSLSVEEIKDSEVLELSWNLLQYGPNEMNVSAPVLREEIMNILRLNTQKFLKTFYDQVQALRFNCLLDYCFFNLVNGNDIYQLIEKFLHTKYFLDRHESLEKKSPKIKHNLADVPDGIPLSYFIRGVRQPLLYKSRSATQHSGVFSLVTGEIEKNRVILDIKIASELGDLRKILINFTKTYIELKQKHFEEENILFKEDMSLPTALSLLHELQEGLLTKQITQSPTRLDSLLKKLISLLLWDYKKKGLTDEIAIEEVMITLESFPTSPQEIFVGEESLQKYLNEVKKSIRYIAKELLEKNVQNDDT